MTMRNQFALGLIVLALVAGAARGEFSLEKATVVPGAGTEFQVPAQVLVEEVARRTGIMLPVAPKPGANGSIQFRAADANDKQPPTTPPGFWGDIIDGATEAMVFFGNSQDNVTAPEHIRYYVYLNGQFDGATIDPYPHQFSMYLTLGIENKIEVYAVDEAGNRSIPATLTIDLRTP